MDIRTRKYDFLQEFMKINDLTVITAFEKLLVILKSDDNNSPMTAEALNRRIDQSMQDSKNGRIISAEKLKEQVQQWS